MADAVALKDRIFNAETVGRLAADFAAGVPGFDAGRYCRACLAGFDSRALMARMAWMADCAALQLAADFPTMADQIEASLPPPLSPDRGDDDHGHFIYGVAGILAERHGLADHTERALDLIHAATQRFSMEFAIRAFLNQRPDATLARMRDWAGDDHYHVRRLVSEGTRPRLPWGAGVRLCPAQTLPLLDRLHADPTRFVTRSVANHLNDLSRSAPGLVLDRLATWRAAGLQDPDELAWMTRHALRTLIKRGDVGALAALGYRADADVAASVGVDRPVLRIGEALEMTLTLESAVDLPVLVDYRLCFARPGGKTAEKVFKLRTAQLSAGTPLTLTKRHPLKADATTFRLHPGAHRITVQVNGRDVAEAQFTLTA